MRLTRLPRSISAFLAVILLAGSAAAMALPPRIETEATAKEGQASLVVRVYGEAGELKGVFPGAEVFLNRSRLGYSPLSLEALAPGTYLVGVEAPGYYPQEISLGFSEKTLYKLSFTLERKTGFLSLGVSPADAQARIDGRESSQGLIRLPTGRHEVEVSRFGYKTQSYSVEIGWNMTTALEARLDLAPFELSALSSIRPAMDPRNAAGLGASPLFFSVSSWGAGRLEVLDPSGRPVASWDFPLFDTWNQRLTWRGRDEAGLPLPDGEYRAVLEAWPLAPGQTSTEAKAGEKERRELALQIDSRLALSPFGTSGAVIGLLHFPDPGRFAAGTSSLGLGLQVGPGALAGQADLGFETSWAHSFGQASLAASLGLGGPRSEAASSSGNASLSLAWALREAASPFSAAAVARIAWLGADGSEASWTRSDLGSGIGLEGGIPLALALGKLHLGIDPGLRLAFPLASASASALASPVLRAGLWYGDYRLRAGLSALAAPASFEKALGGELPISAAAELHWAPGEWPLAFSAALCAAFDGADFPTGAELAFFLGLDFLF